MNRYLLLAFFGLTAFMGCAWARSTPKDVETDVKRTSPHELRDKHEKENKSPEEQANYDKEILFGGDEDIETIHDLDEEEQQEKLKGFLIEKMDTNKDNVIDKNELLDYTKKAIIGLQKRELKEEFSNLDTDKDGEITYKEFAEELYGDDLKDKQHMDEKEKTELDRRIENNKKMWAAADKNGDGKMNMEELEIMRNPHLSEATKKIFIEKYISKFDSNKDGAVDVDEYISTLKHNDDGDDENQKYWIPYEKEKFKTKHDSDGDGLLKGEEIYKWQGPVNLDQLAQHEVEHLMNECDADKDEKLTFDEILESHHLWLQSEATSFGQHLMDEL